MLILFVFKALVFVLLFPFLSLSLSLPLSSSLSLVSISVPTLLPQATRAEQTTDDEGSETLASSIRHNSITRNQT